MDFTTFKLNIIETTGLAKDALHIYVGVGVYLLSLFILRPIIKSQNIRAFLALLVVISVALLGEYFDNRHIILPKGIWALKGIDIKASIHDLINTCLLPFVLFALNKWTTIFHPTAPAPTVRLLKKRS
ncbi:hypothetical protein ACTXGJ_10280 [Psychrobacter sp. 1Y11]|uniref:hypothetical protein n=1 Tax=Psychrobacter sp. 1Y11 TaxID=3457446 RepID=UPI003FD549F9